MHTVSNYLYWGFSAKHLESLFFKCHPCDEPFLMPWSTFDFVSDVFLKLFFSNFRVKYWLTFPGISNYPEYQLDLNWMLTDMGFENLFEFFLNFWFHGDIRYLAFWNNSQVVVEPGFWRSLSLMCLVLKYGQTFQVYKVFVANIYHIQYFI